MRMTKLKAKTSFIVIILISLFFCFTAFANPVIPGASGFGINTRAAYGGKNGTPVICIVNSLGSAGGSCSNGTRNGVSVKTGTFRQCLEYNDNGEGKIILFEVSGTIEANSEPFIYQINTPYLTIAAQTAPSPGIQLKNLTIQFRHTHDALVQHLRFRVGDRANGTEPENRDGLKISPSTGSSVYNVVVDHCSISWAIDENLEIYEIAGADLHDITVSNSIISESLYDSLHPEGPHSKGVIVGKNTERVSLIRNLFAHNYDRNPLLQGISSAVINNLIYNAREDWGPTMISPWVTHKTEVAYAGNVVKKGINSRSDQAIFLLGPVNNSDTWPYLDDSKLYVDDNIFFKADSDYQEPSSDGWDAVIDYWGNKQSMQVQKPSIWPPNAYAFSSKTVEQFIIDNVGARPDDRDTVDSRIINDVISGTGTIINSQNDVGGWPSLAQKSITLNLPSNPHADDDNDGYSNLEEWLHNYSSELLPPFLKIANNQ
jgi:hypothetical protein